MKSLLVGIPDENTKASILYYGAGHVRATKENKGSSLTPLWGYTDDGTGLEDQVGGWVGGWVGWLVDMQILVSV